MIQNKLTAEERHDILENHLANDLRKLDENGAIEIKTVLDTARSNVARQVAVLEENGFLTRTPSATDRRIMQLFPTEKTLELLPKITPILGCWEACLTSDISDEEKAVLERVLARMKEKASWWMENRPHAGE